jgi:hypothetical protein
MPAKRTKNPAAVALARLRAKSLTEDERKEIARQGGLKGGKARAASLTAEQLTAIGKKAAAARWAKKATKKKAREV